MNEALLIDMFYAAPELWYTLGLGLAVLLILMGAQGINILKLRQKNYFANVMPKHSMRPKTVILLLFIPTRKSMTPAKRLKNAARAV